MGVVLIGDLLGGHDLKTLGIQKFQNFQTRIGASHEAIPKGNGRHLVFQSHPFFQVLLLAVKFQGGYSEDILLA